MKKIIIISILIFSLCIASLAFASGKVLCTATDNLNGYNTITCTCTADASDNTFPSTKITSMWSLISSSNPGHYLYSVEIQPSTPAPTNGFSVTLVDAMNYDILAGQGASQSSANTSFFKGLNAFLDSAPTINITGNSVSSAVVIIKMVLVR